MAQLLQRLYQLSEKCLCHVPEVIRVLWMFRTHILDIYTLRYPGKRVRTISLNSVYNLRHLAEDTEETEAQSRIPSLFSPTAQT